MSIVAPLNLFLDIQSDILNVYQLNLNAFAGSIEPLWGVLSNDEKADINRLRFGKDRMKRICAYGGLRLLLAQTFECEPEDVRYDCLAAQFAVVASSGPHRFAKPLRCAFAYGGNFALVALMESGSASVDIKQHEDVPEQSAIINRHFSAREQELLSRFPSSLRKAMFFQYLARKSALLKTQDTWPSPQMCELDVAPLAHGLENHCQQHKLQDDWSLISLQLDPSHSAALAINSPTASLRQTQVTPAMLLSGKPSQVGDWTLSAQVS